MLGVFISLIIVSLVCVNALAGDNPFSGGDGSEDYPYLISSLEQLESISGYGADSSYSTSYFKLINDINCDVYDYSNGLTTPEDFDTLFQCSGFDNYDCEANPAYQKNEVFTGNFDGQNHKICGLNIGSNEENQYVGLFGCVDRGAIIKNIFLVGVQVSGVNDIGALVGYNKGTIENVHLINDMFGSYYGVIGGTTGNNVGGLVGINEGTLYRCSSNGGVVIGGERVGGLVGWNRNFYSDAKGNKGDIYGKGCYSYYKNNEDQIDIRAVSLNSYSGENYQDMKNGYGHIVESYSYSVVTGENVVGGLVGQNDFHIVNSFVNGQFNNRVTTPEIIARNGYSGGLVGLNTESASIESSYVSNNVAVLGLEAAGGLVGINDKGVIRSCFGGNYDSTLNGNGGLVGGWAECNAYFGGKILNSGGGGNDKKGCVNFRSSYDSEGGFIPAGIIYGSTGYVYTTEKIISSMNTDPTGDLQKNKDMGLIDRFYNFFESRAIQQNNYYYNELYMQRNTVSCPALDNLECNKNPINSFKTDKWFFGSVYVQPVFYWTPLTYCGDGDTNSPSIQGFNEVCDDGSDNGRYEGKCRSDCLGIVKCGNKIIELNEECDDGNSNDADGCKNDCTISSIQEDIKRLYWINIAGTKIKSAGLKTDVKGTIELTKSLGEGYRIKWEIQKDQIGFDKVVNDGEFALFGANTKYYINWKAGLDSNTGVYSTGKYHFRISFDNGDTWYSTKNGEDFYTTYGELEVTPSLCGNNNQDTGENCDGGVYCTDCKCQTGYVDDTSSLGCKTTTKTENCGAANGRKYVLKDNLELDEDELCKTGITASPITTTSTGDWTWTCGTSQCSATEIKKVGCSPEGEESCARTDLSICKNKDWDFKGCVVGKCGATADICCGDTKCNNAETNANCPEDCSVITTGECTKKLIDGSPYEDKDSWNTKLSSEDNKLCTLNEENPEIYSITTGKGDGSYYNSWDCDNNGYKECKVLIKGFETATTYGVSDKGCERGEEYQTMIYYDKESQQPTGETSKIYCPAALPFFTIRNVVAVVIIVALGYIILAMRKKQNKKSKSSKKKRR